MKSRYGGWQGQVQRGVMILLALLLFSVPAAAAGFKTVLVFGDSLSAGYGLATKQGWVALTAERMRTSHPGWRVVNASISGETTAGGASRIGAEMARSRPSVVVVELGSNDGLRGLAVSQTRANLERIIRTVQGANAKVLLIGMRLPPNFGPQYTRTFEQTFVELSKQHRTAFLPFLLEPVAANRSYFQDDNMHPTAAAQPKLRDYVWTGLRPLLK
jgi:acyl-CoA thioesterase-1